MLDDMQARICQTQADVFEWGAEKNYGFPEFSDKYLSSKFCANSMDSSYSTFHLREPLEHMDFIRKELPDIDEFVGIKESFPPEMAYWIGYMYRALAFEMNVASRDVLAKYSFDKMHSEYPALHTLSYDMAADVLLGRVLLEYKGIEFYMPEELIKKYRAKNGRPLSDDAIDEIVAGRIKNSSELTAQFLAACIREYILS